jgi:septum formation protein
MELPPPSPPSPSSPSSGPSRDRPLILASTSPRRRELLERVGVSIEIVAPEIDESALAGEEPAAYVRRVAAAKSAAVAGRAPDRWVLAADTVVVIDGDILGKPDGPAGARAMLSRLSARTHRVITAFALRAPGGDEAVREVVTEVSFRALGGDDIAAYLRSGEWRGKAGAYAAQGIAAAFVSGVRGSFSNVVGLPLSDVLEELARAGGPAPDYARGVPAE